MRLSPPLSLLFLLLPLSGACLSSDSQAPLETSVRSGLNDRFLAEDLDVAAMTEIFEGESREVAHLTGPITATLGLLPNMSVADIGAGTGLFMPSFADAVGELGSVLAVELSPVFIEHLEKRAAEEGLEQVSVITCTERSVELEAGAADVVFICDTYHHFEYPASVMASIRKALRPGGLLVIVDFERIPALSDAWILDHVRASKEEVLEEIEAAGFEYQDELRIPGMKQNYLLRFRH